MAQERILVVEDETIVALDIQRVLRRLGYNVLAVVASGEDAVQRAAQLRPDLVLMDIHLRGPMDGIEAAAQLRAQMNLPVVYLTAHTDEQTLQRAKSTEPLGYLTKPFEERDLATTLEMALHKHRLDRKKLLQSERRFALLVENLKDYSIIFLDEQGRVAGWNAGAERITGYRQEEALGQLFTLLFPSEDVRSGRPQQALRRALTEGRFEEEGWRLRKDGSRFWAQTLLTTLRAEDGSVGGLVEITRDDTERRAAQEALQQSEERYRSLFEAMPQPMWVYDTATLQLLAVNEAAVAHYGYSPEDFLAMTLERLYPSEEWPAVRAAAAWPTPVPGDCLQAERVRHCKKDGTPIEVEIYRCGLTFEGRAAALVLALDVTEKIRLQEQFQQAQKMEAMGRLAGGVAHDFNNLLTVITGCAELLLDALAAGDHTHELAGEILKAGDRAASLTRQLLAFSRRQIIAPQVLDLHEVVAETEKMLRRVIGEDIELQVSSDADLGSIKADPGQVVQVLLNLAANARDAMPQGGKLTIQTRNAELSDDYARHHPGTRAGRYVLMMVTDTGHGIPPQAQERIWEPFFTTKGLGRGTGLGLAVVHGVLNQAGGHAEVHSSPDQGTTLKLYWPRVEAQPKKGKSYPGAANWPRGHETVLLVEDEDAVRGLVYHVLDRCGYTVLQARDSHDALQQAREHAGPIDLLMTDVVLPSVNGREVAEQVARLHPNIRTLYVSGYTDDAIVRRGILRQEVAFLQKPFSPAVLAHKVREVLDQA